jgi:hypothetical protein
MGKLLSRRQAIGRVVLALLVAGAAILAIYHPNSLMPSRATIIANNSCALPIERGVELSAGDRCLIGALAQRCTGLDQCFVDCLTSGAGVNVGGGCGHICNRGAQQRWAFPVGAWAQCYSIDRSSTLPL